MSKKKILIVDDSKIVRVMIHNILSDLRPDWDIDEAGDGEEAIIIASKKDFDYFSVDINMPKIDGFEMIAKLKPKQPNSKFALMTANIQLAIHDQADELNVGLIYKPITVNSVEQLIAYLES